MLHSRAVDADVSCKSHADDMRLQITCDAKSLVRTERLDPVAVETGQAGLPQPRRARCRRNIAASDADIADKSTSGLVIGRQSFALLRHHRPARRTDRKPDAIEDDRTVDLAQPKLART